MRRWTLGAAALLLAATALFHLTGTAMAAGWADGEPGRIVALLWVSCASVWLIVAAGWAWHAVVRRGPGWPFLITTAAIPLAVALPLLVVSQGGHPGAYMLLGASALALWSGRKAGV